MQSWTPDAVETGVLDFPKKVVEGAENLAESIVDGVKSVLPDLNSPENDDEATSP